MVLPVIQRYGRAGVLPRGVVLQHWRGAAVLVAACSRATRFLPVADDLQYHPALFLIGPLRIAGVFAGVA